MGKKLNGGSPFYTFSRTKVHNQRSVMDNSRLARLMESNTSEGTLVVAHLSLFDLITDWVQVPVIGRNKLHDNTLMILTPWDKNEPIWEILTRNWREKDYKPPKIQYHRGFNYTASHLVTLSPDYRTFEMWSPRWNVSRFVGSEWVKSHQHLTCLTRNQMRWFLWSDKCNQGSWGKDPCNLENITLGFKERGPS